MARYAGRTTGEPRGVAAHGGRGRAGATDWTVGAAGLEGTFLALRRRTIYRFVSWLGATASLVAVALALLPLPGPPVAPVAASALFYLTLALLLGRGGSLERLEPTLLLGSVSLLALQLWQALYLPTTPETGAATAVAVLLWYPVVYLLAFLAYPEGVALRYALGLLALLVALTLPHALVTTGGGMPTDGLLVPLQAYLANGSVILVLHALASLQGKLERVELVAEAMRRLAYTDALTDVPNRRQLETLLDHEARRAGRYDRPFSFIMIDVDDFKEVNDSLGHEAGDGVLVEIAARLRSQVRASDTVGRWGGEEFAILAPETPLPDALRLAELVRGYVGDASRIAGRSVTISLGVASYRGNERVDELVARADRALYRAKAEGKNRVGHERDAGAKDAVVAATLGAQPPG